MKARHLDPALELEVLEERAALIQEGEGCTRFLAEQIAARAVGFNSWIEAKARLMQEAKKRG